MKKTVYLASDNWSPAHPEAIKALVEANEGYAHSYGTDHWSEKASKVIQKVFKKECLVFFCPTGTGANVFGLKLACCRYESVLCTDIAHIQYQEAGAAESIIGCKLLSIPHQQGKVTPEALRKKLNSERAFGLHSTSPRVLSLTQPTEYGTVYQLEELKALSKICREENLLLHIDGSRLCNAAVSLQVSLHEMLQDITVDLLSLGGTKNGLVGAEALLIFNDELKKGSSYIHKQTLQLLSKMRYSAAQFIPFFTHNLWHKLAQQANDKAQKIAAIIADIPHLTLNYPVETNQIFFSAPSKWIPLIQKQIACYPWDQEKNELRFITSWCTSDKDVKEVRAILTKLGK